MEYTITNVQRRDEWNMHGNMMVDYALALDGQQGWVKLTQKTSTAAPEVGQRLTGIIEIKQTSNGKSYKKFKKVNPDYGNQGRQTPPAQNDKLIEGKLDYIIQMLEKLTGTTGRSEVPQDTPEPYDDPFKGMGI